jgi:hypothetical protein
MKTPLVCTLVALAQVATAARARDTVSAPPTSCDIGVAVDVAKKADAAKVVAKIVAAASKQRGPEALRLRGSGLDAAVVTALGRAPALAQVATLDVPCLGAAALGALLSPGVFPGVTKLQMRQCRLDDRAAAALAGLAARDAIATVDLGSGKASPAVLKVLLGLGRRAPMTVVVSGLRALPTAALAELGKVAPNPAVTFSVAVRCPELGRLDKTAFLKHVSRIDVVCGDAGAKALARAANTAALKRVAIDACDSGDGEAEDYEMTRESALAIVEAPGLARIEELAFYAHEPCEQPGIGRSGLADALSAPFAPTLQSLELEEQSLGRKGLALLASTERLPALRHLVLRGERLVADDVRGLVQGGPLAGRLEELVLRGIERDEGWALDDKVGAVLAASFKMPKLRRLDVLENWFSSGTKELLRRASWASQLERMEIATNSGALACDVPWHGAEVPLDPQ